VRSPARKAAKRLSLQNGLARLPHIADNLRWLASSRVSFFSIKEGFYDVTKEKPAEAGRIEI
jgi:hypothetical protein